MEVRRRSIPWLRPVLATAATAALAAGLASPAAAFTPVTRNFDLKAHLDEYSLGPTANSYSACWSYIHSDGREYAVIGTNGGTAIYNVTDPASTYRVGFIAGRPSLWREMKSYRNWIYVVTEGTGVGQGLQIIRMTNPEAPVLAATYTGNFVRSHTVSVDTSRAILICNGTRNASGNASGMRVLSLANPEAPVEIATWPDMAPPVPDSQYVHDCVPIGNRLFASSIYYGIERVFDFTVPSNPVELTQWTYPGGFTHNSWPDSAGTTLYVTDEVNGEPLKIFDISTLGAPVLRNAITSNPSAIVHNAHVRGHELFLSNYTEGIRALDITDPWHPAEFASADSYFGLSGGYFGVWEVCPFFPSGTVIASDMQSGLYVYRPIRDYGLVRVRVRDQDGAPLPGADVYVTTQGDSLKSPADGIVQFAPNPGTHTILAKKFGYTSASASRTVVTGARDTITLTLTARPRVTFGGTLRSAVGGAPLLDGEVELEATPLHAHSNGAGAYTLADVPADTYRIGVHRPGYVPLDYEREIGPAFPGEDYTLAPAALWDSLETNTGWTVGATGDDATSGQWVRVEPLGTGDPQPVPALLAPGVGSAEDGRISRRGAGPLHEGHEEDGATPGDVQPEFDRTPGAGSLCWVTGQGADPGSIGQADVDGGHTSLTTPAYDVAAMTDPVIGFWRWFYTSDPFGVDDYLRVLISSNGGATWVEARRLTGLHNHWEEDAIRVNDFVTPTSNVRLRFEAADLGTGTVVEAAIDDLTLYEADGSTVGAPRPDHVALRTPWPNPSGGEVRLALEMPRAGAVEASVVDVQGRLVRTLHRGAAPAGRVTLTWDGNDASGRRAAAGLYFVRALADGERRDARIVRVN